MQGGRAKVRGTDGRVRGLPRGDKGTRELKILRFTASDSSWRGAARDGREEGHQPTSATARAARSPLQIGAPIMQQVLGLGRPVVVT